MGSAARIRTQPGDPRELRRSSASRYGIALPGAPPARTPVLDCRRMEGFGEQAAHQGVPADCSRQESVDFRAIPLGSDFGSHRRSIEPGEKGGYMKSRYEWRKAPPCARRDKAGASSD